MFFARPWSCASRYLATRQHMDAVLQCKVDVQAVEGAGGFPAQLGPKDWSSSVSCQSVQMLKAPLQSSLLMD